MLNPMMAAAFEYMQKARDVGVDIVMGVIERVAHTGLRGEMDHALRLLRGKGRVHDGAVGEVGLDEMEAVAGLEPREPGFLQRHVVIGIEIIEPDHLIAPLEQANCRVIADEAGGAGE